MALINGSFVRREHDGMLGRVGRAWGLPRSGHTQLIQDVVWLGEWTKGDLNDELRRKRRITALTGAEAEEAARAFARLTCTICGGSGMSSRPGERCSAPDCLLGRRRGVHPPFDASYAAYKREIDAYDAADRGASRGSGPAAPTQSAPDRQLPLRFAATCASCGKELARGEVVLAGRVAGRWSFRCLTHGKGAQSDG